MKILGHCYVTFGDSTNVYDVLENQTVSVKKSNGHYVLQIDNKQAEKFQHGPSVGYVNVIGKMSF